MPAAQLGGGCSGTFFASWASAASRAASSASRFRSSTPLCLSSVCLRLRRAPRRALATYSSKVTAGGRVRFARLDSGSYRGMSS